MNVHNDSTPIVTARIEAGNGPLRVQEEQKGKLSARKITLAIVATLLAVPEITGIALLAIGSAQDDVNFKKTGLVISVVYPVALFVFCGSCVIDYLSSCGKKICSSESGSSSHDYYGGGGAIG